MDLLRPLRSVAHSLIIRRAETPGLAESWQFRLIPATFRLSAFAAARRAGRPEAAAAIAQADVAQRSQRLSDAATALGRRGVTVPPFLPANLDRVERVSTSRESVVVSEQSARRAWALLEQGDVVGAREASAVAIFVADEGRLAAMRRPGVREAAAVRRRMVAAGYLSDGDGYSPDAATATLLDYDAASVEAEVAVDLVLDADTAQDRRTRAQRLSFEVQYAGDELSPGQRLVQAASNLRVWLWERAHQEEAQILVGSAVDGHHGLRETRDVNRTRRAILAMVVDAWRDGAEVTPNGAVVGLGDSTSEAVSEMRAELEANRADLFAEVQARAAEHRWAGHPGLVARYGTRPSQSLRDELAVAEDLDACRVSIIEVIEREGGTIDARGSVVGLSDGARAALEAAEAEFLTLHRSTYDGAVPAAFDDPATTVVVDTTVASRAVNPVNSLAP